MDPALWPNLSEWDPDFKKFHDDNLAAMNLPETNTAEEVVEWRTRSGPMMKDMLYAQLDFSDVEQSDVEIPARDGAPLRSLVFKPSHPSASCGPLVVLFHGGGWVIGTAEMEAPTAVALVKDFGAIVVSVEYRLAPEYPFPTQVNDSWDALKWCAANASNLGADPSKGFLIGGESAGGNIAAALQHLARDEQLSPPVTGTWLGYPATLCPGADLPDDLKAIYTSYDQNADAPVLKKKSMYQVRNFCHPDPKSELFSPLLWSSGHAGLAKTYIQVCGLDPLRDDGLLYELLLRKAGVATKLDTYPGVPHGVDLMMFGQVAAARKVREDRASAFKWLLGA